MQILYEDAVLLFLDKPAGVVVQRGYDAEEPVLFEEVQEYVRAKGAEAFLLQRLDRGTTGVIFFSKDPAMNVRLTRQFERKEIRKRYVALCEGIVDAPLTIDAPIARIGAIKFGVREEGKRAITEVAPIAAGRDATLVRLALLTGRTHQIRVHLASIGHPLTGDWLYGERNATRPMLHALEIEMLHPVSREPLIVRAPLPPDFIEESAARGIEDAVAAVEASKRGGYEEPSPLVAIATSKQGKIPS